MKRNLIFIFFMLLAGACLDKGTDTIVLPEHRESYLPKSIAENWNAAIKCAEQTTVAIELNLTTQSDKENFTATGSGYDYNGEAIDVEVKGIYNRELNILSADVRYDFVESGVYRKDHFAVDFDLYTAGSYIDMIKLDESYPGGPVPSCETQIKLFY
jgi:hypothetical protein